MGTLNLNQHTIGTGDLEDKLNQFHGHIKKINISETPIDDLEVLTENYYESNKLHFLKEIDICDTFVVNLTPLSVFIKLQKIYANNLGLDDISSLSNLVNIKELYLEYNNIVDLVPLQQLKELRVLDLMGNKSLVNVEPIANLKLQKLYILDTGIYKIDQILPLKDNTYERLTTNESLRFNVGSLIQKKEIIM